MIPSGRTSLLAVVLTLFSAGPIAAQSSASAAAAQPSTHSALPADALFSALRWREVGPMRAGLTRALAGVPGQPYTFYIGAVGGGVF